MHTWTHRLVCATSQAALNFFYCFLNLYLKYKRYFYLPFPGETDVFSVAALLVLPEITILTNSCGMRPGNTIPPFSFDRPKNLLNTHAALSTTHTLQHIG